MAYLLRVWVLAPMAKAPHSPHRRKSMNHRNAQLPWRLALVMAFALGAAACNRDGPPTSTEGVVRATGAKPNWVGCTAGDKYTGGGRVDPDGVGKVTFGFNVDAGTCDRTDMKGSIQVVYHESQTLVHSLTEENFASYTDPVRGSCGEWDGTARVKHVFAGSDWHEHHYYVVVCDKAEPGRGADRFSFYLDGPEDGLHNNVIDEVLTGGNIQAHGN
jgi:hypothetical protein